MRTTGDVTIEVGADPITVYGLVADVTRIGEFSPECRNARVATRLEHRDRRGQVPRPQRLQVDPLVEAVRSRHLGPWSRVLVPHDPDLAQTRLHACGPTASAPVATGTQVTESYEVVKLPPAPILAVIRRTLPHHLDMRPHMQRTLEALKHTAQNGEANNGTTSNFNRDPDPAD